MTPRHFSALAEENQTVIFNGGYEAILSDSEIKVICSPSDPIQIGETKIGFELQIQNNSSQPITISLENLRAFNAKGKPLRIASAEQLESAARKELDTTHFHGTAHKRPDNVRLRSSDDLLRSNNQMLIDVQEEAARERWVEKKLAIQNGYLQKQTILPHSSYRGFFLMSDNQHRNKQIQLQLFIPETHETRRFTFSMS
jgi:hypothetical protein